MIYFSVPKKKFIQHTVKMPRLLIPLLAWDYFTKKDILLKDLRLLCLKILVRNSLLLPLLILQKIPLTLLHNNLIKNIHIQNLILLLLWLLIKINHKVKIIWVQVKLLVQKIRNKNKCYHNFNNNMQWWIYKMIIIIIT